jgi:hypothetical protein
MFRLSAEAESEAAEHEAGDGVRIPRGRFWSASDGAGIKAETLRRAEKELGIKPQKYADGWLWQLPELVTTVSVEAAAEARIERDWELK